ncbi:MAG TPA: MFS transporter [Candidatus Limnocylindrales bacterium]|nr:MFS transporter [Candidatus Limnocylindrales bacterium]
MATSGGAQGAAMQDEGRGRWLGLAMLSLGVAMIIVDATIVNVAVPSIIRELDLDSTTAEWINTVYALVFAALLVTLGRVGDLLGRRALYLVGLVIFGAASVLAGAAPTGELLIAARVLQGIGGAMILPATQSILNTNFRGRDRAIAFGIWGATIGGMAAIGPLLGGWLTTSFSWRWAFFINIPVAIVAIIGTLRFIGESKDEDAEAGLDVPGFLLITFGLGAFVFGLIEGRTYGWWTPEKPFELFGWTWPLVSISIIPFLIGGGVLLLALFLVVEHRRRVAGKFFLFDVDLWRYPAFRYGNLAGTIVALGEFGLLFALPLFLQAVILYSAFETGLVFLSLAIGAFVAAPLAARLSNAYGPRRVVTLGMALEAVGIVATTLLIGPEVSGLGLGIPLFVYGIGVGLATAQLTSIVLSDIPAERSGLASGANSTMRQVGSALGIAILGTVLFTSLGNGVREGLATLPGLPPQAIDGIATAMEESAGQALPQIAAQPGSELIIPILEDAFVDATRLAGFTATGFVLLGVVLSLLLPKMPPHHEPEREPVDLPDDEQPVAEPGTEPAPATA